MSLYLKWTHTGRIPSYQGGAPISVGEWTPVVSDPVPCERGWHACRWDDVLEHISDELWICELAGPIVEANDKVAASSLLLVEQVAAVDERTLRHFAADCAERVLPIFGAVRPDDDRPRLAIHAARDFADGKITAAAGAAAGAAARAAAWAAAWAAGDAAGDAWAARDAAGAAGDAAGAAAGAAGDAARAAGDAAWAAARAAARAARAAGDAAWAAERAWQLDRLLVHYAGLNPAEFARRVS